MAMASPANPKSNFTGDVLGYFQRALGPTAHYSGADAVGKSLLSLIE